MLSLLSWCVRVFPCIANTCQKEQQQREQKVKYVHSSRRRVTLHTTALILLMTACLLHMAARLLQRAHRIRFPKSSKQGMVRTVGKHQLEFKRLCKGLAEVMSLTLRRSRSKVVRFHRSLSHSCWRSLLPQGGVLTPEEIMMWVLLAFANDVVAYHLISSTTRGVLSRQ